VNTPQRPPLLSLVSGVSLPNDVPTVIPPPCSTGRHVPPAQAETTAKTLPTHYLALTPGRKSLGYVVR